MTTPQQQQKTHTPEPWEESKSKHCHVLISQAPETLGWVVARLDQTVLGSEQANAQRIVACVNFLSQIPRELLTPENAAAVRKLLNC